MKLGVIRKILKDDLKGGDLPGWVDGMLYIINQFMDQVVTALKGNLTFSDNFACKEVLISMTHNTPQKITGGSNKHITGLLVKNAEGQIITGHGFTRNTDGSINVTILFNAGGSTKANCTLEVLY